MPIEDEYDPPLFDEFLDRIKNFAETSKVAMTAVSWLWPAIIYGVAAQMVHMTNQDVSLTAEEKEKKNASIRGMGAFLTASWALTQSQSLAAEAGCLAVMGIAPFSAELNEVYDATVSQNWMDPAQDIIIKNFLRVMGVKVI